MKFHLDAVYLDDGAIHKTYSCITCWLTVHQRECLPFQGGEKVSFVTAIRHYGACVTGKSQTRHGAIKGDYAADMLAVDDLYIPLR